MKILITAPSLDENENVSGISTVVRHIVERGKDEFVHFQAGRRDDAAGKFRWIKAQIFLAPRFFQKIKSEKIRLIHINTALNPLSIFRDYALVKTARLAKSRIVLHLHGGEFLAREFTSGWLKTLAEKMLRGANAVVVLSELERRIVERRWKNLNVKVLENAVALDEVLERKKEAAEENLKTILFLGRLHESKGLPEIVEACRVLRDENFRVRCFGAGEMRDFFTAEMSRILGENFYYGGVASGAEKWKQFAQSDIFLLPSRYGEGLPMAMLEAMAAGCVVVAADVASIRAVVRSGENGFLVEPYNAAQVAERLKFLLSDKADWKLLRENARRTIEEKFAIDDYMKKLERIYLEAAG